MRIRARLFSLAFSLLLLASSALAADFFFVGDTDADFNDATNWSATSGGGGGAGVPGSSDVARFDANSPDCTLDVDIEVAGLKLDVGYTAVVDTNGQALTITYDSGNGVISIAGGEIDLGTATHTIKGNWSYTDGTITPGTGKVQFCAPNGATIDIDGDFTLNDVRFYHSGSGSSHKKVNLNDTLTVDGDLELEGYGSGGWHFYLNGGGELVVRGDIAGNSKVIRGDASLSIIGDVGDQRQTDLWWGSSGTYTVDKGTRDTLVWAGTEKFGDYTTGGNSTVTMVINSAIDATTDTPSVWLCGYGHGDVTVQGDLNIYDLKFYRPGGTGHTTYDLSGGTVTVENALTLDLAASGGWHVYLDNGTLAAKGDVTFANNNDDWWGSALIKMSGSEAAALTGGGLATKGLSVEVAKSDHAMVSLGGDLSLSYSENGDLTVTSGALDLAGYDLTVAGELDVDDTLKLKGDETITGTVDLDQTTSTVIYHDSSVAATVNSLAASFWNLRLGAGKTHNFTASQTVTIKGFFGSDGTSASKAVLRSTSDGTAWKLDVQGSARLLYVDAKDSDASPGSQVVAYNSTDSGNNTNWSFGTVPLYTWTGQGADNNWSTAGNWAQSTVPGTANTALFDGTSVKKCVLDGNVEVAGFKLEAGHTGVVDASDYAIQVNYDAGSGILSMADGLLKLGSAAHTIKGDFAYTGGAIDAGSSKVQFYAPNAASIDLDGDFSLNDVRFYHAGSGSSHKTVNLTGTLIVNGGLELEGYGSGGWHFYLSGGGELVAKGDIAGNGKVIRGNANLTVAGNGEEQNQTDLWWGTSGTYAVNKPSGLLFWSGTEKFGDYTTGSGSDVLMVLTSDVDAVAGKPCVWLCGYGHGDLTLQGGLTVYDLKFYRPGGTGHTTYDLSGGTITAENDLTLDMTASGGWHVYINNGALEAKGDTTFANNDADWWGSATITMTGWDNATLTGGGLSTKAMSIEVAKSDGAVVALVGELALSCDNNDALTITSGVLDLAGYEIKVGDLTVAAAGTLRLHGDETITRDSLTLSEGCTVDYGGPGTYGSLLLGSAYSSVTFSGSGTYTLAADLDVNQTLALAAGALSDGGKTIYLAGNWVQGGGSLSATGSLVLDGEDQLIQGSTTFNNLTKTVTTAQVLTFDAGQTQTVTGALTLQGAADNLLSLRSSTEGESWTIDPQSSRTISYLSVQDSQNINPVPVNAISANCEDVGNNLYWIFTAPPIGTWTGLGSDNNWSTAANWAQNTVPGSTHVALFNDTSAKNCVMDVDIQVKGMKLEAEYTGSVDAATYAMTIDYASGEGIFSVANGELKLGSGTHTIKGDFSYTGGTITAGTGKVQFFAPNGASIDVEGDFALNDVRFCHSGSGSSHKKVNLNGTLTVNGGLELEGYGSGGWHMYLNGGGTLLAEGDITGNGKVIRGDVNLTIDGATGDQTQTNLCWGTSGTYTVEKAAGTLVLAGTEKLGDWTAASDTKVVLTSAVDATTNTPEVWLCGKGHGDVTLQGSVTVYDLKFYRSGGTGHTTYDLAGGTITVNNTLTLDMSATGGWKVYGQNGTLVCKGSVVTTNNQVTDWSEMVFVLSGTAAQSVDLDGLDIKSLAVENTSATVTLSGGFTAADTIGASAGASVVFANGESFSCAKLAFNGTTGSPIALRSDSAGTAWLLNVSERYQTASCVDVKDSDASGGELVYAVSSTDSGNNTNWSFLDQVKVQITTANSSATSPAWVQGEVGPNVTEVKVKVNSGTAFDAERPSRMRFFADNTSGPLGITLSATSTTQVEVTAKDELENEDSDSQNITWAATDLAGSDPSTVIKIRKGDSLLLTASDSEGGGTTLEIDADGDDTYDYSGAPDDEFPHQYNTAGSFVAKAKIDDTVVGSVTVVVISVDLQGPVAGEVNYQREKDVLVSPASEAGNITFTGEFSSSDPSQELGASVKETTANGATLYVKPLKRGTPIVYARLSADGPIIAKQEVDEFTVEILGRTQLLVNADTRESKSRFTMRPYIPNLRVNFNMFGSQSTFEGGITQFYAYTSGDFTQVYDEETGETIGTFNYIIEVPDGEDSACYNAKVQEEETLWSRVGGPTTVNPVAAEIRLRFIGVVRDDEGLPIGEELDFSRELENLHPVDARLLEDIYYESDNDLRLALFRKLEGRLYKVRVEAPTGVSPAPLDLRTEYDQALGVETEWDGNYLYIIKPLILFNGEIDAETRAYFSEEYVLLDADNTVGDLTNWIEAQFAEIVHSDEVIRVVVISCASEEEVPWYTGLPIMASKSAMACVVPAPGEGTVPPGSGFPRLLHPLEFTVRFNQALDPESFDIISVDITSNVNNVQYLDLALDETGVNSKVFANRTGSVKVSFPRDFEFDPDDPEELSVAVYARKICVYAVEKDIVETGADTKELSSTRRKIRLTFNATLDSVDVILSVGDETHEETLQKTVADPLTFANAEETTSMVVDRSTGFGADNVDDMTVRISCQAMELPATSIDALETGKASLVFATDEINLPDQDMEDEDENEMPEAEEDPVTGEYFIDPQPMDPQSRLDESSVRLRVYGPFPESTYSWNVRVVTDSGAETQLVKFTKYGNYLLSDPLLMVEKKAMSLDPFVEEFRSHDVSPRHAFIVEKGKPEITAEETKEWKSAKTAEKIARYFYGNQGAEPASKSKHITYCYDGLYDLNNVQARMATNTQNGSYTLITAKEVVWLEDFHGKAAVGTRKTKLKIANPDKNKECAPWDLHLTATVDPLVGPALTNVIAQSKKDPTAIAAIVTHGAGNGDLTAVTKTADDIMITPNDFYAGGPKFRYGKLFLASCYASGFTDRLLAISRGKGAAQKWKTPIAGIKSRKCIGERRAILGFKEGLAEKTKNRIADEFNAVLYGFNMTILSEIRLNKDVQDKILIGGLGRNKTIRHPSLVLTETGRNTNTYTSPPWKDVYGATRTVSMTVVKRRKVTTARGVFEVAEVKVTSAAHALYTDLDCLLASAPKWTKAEKVDDGTRKGTGSVDWDQPDCDKTCSDTQEADVFEITLQGKPKTGYAQRDMGYKIWSSAQNKVIATGKIAGEEQVFTPKVAARRGRGSFSCKVSDRVGEKRFQEGNLIEFEIAEDGTVTVLQCVPADRKDDFKEVKGSAGKWKLVYGSREEGRRGYFKLFDQVGGKYASRGTKRAFIYSDAIEIPGSGLKFSIFDKVAAKKGNHYFIAVGKWQWVPQKELTKAGKPELVSTDVHHSMEGGVEEFCKAWYDVFNHAANKNNVTHAYWDAGFLNFTTVAGVQKKMSKADPGDFGLEEFKEE